jgi:hypothetical protein
MSQFDVYKNSGVQSKRVPYVLDVQSNLVSQGLSTRIVVPLYSVKFISVAALKIHVPVSVANHKLIALFDELSSIEVRNLSKVATNLSDKYGARFKDALDVTFFNFP